MLAAVLRDYNNLLLEDIPIPDPGPGEVLIQIQSCGFCATDFKAIRGIRRNVNFPLIPGHEGDHVTHVKEGDDVIIQPSGLWTLPILSYGNDSLLSGVVYYGWRWTG